MILRLSFANIFPEILSIVIKPDADRYIRIKRKSEKNDETLITIDDAEKVVKFM